MHCCSRDSTHTLQFLSKPLFLPPAGDPSTLASPSSDDQGTSVGLVSHFSFDVQTISAKPSRAVRSFHRSLLCHPDCSTGLSGVYGRLPPPRNSGIVDFAELIHRNFMFCFSRSSFVSYRTRISVCGYKRARIFGSMVSSGKDVCGGHSSWY